MSAWAESAQVGRQVGKWLSQSQACYSHRYPTQHFSFKDKDASETNQVVPKICLLVRYMFIDGVSASQKENKKYF